MSTFRTREVPAGLILTIEDRACLNEFRSPTFRAEFFEVADSAEPPRVAIDLAIVDYLSSSGIALLVGFKRRVDARKGLAVFFRVQPVVLDLFRIMKLEKYFAIVDDEAQALLMLCPDSSL